MGGAALDVGCGEGLLVERLSAVCRHVTGVDPDLAALRRAESRLSGRDTITLRHGSVLDLDLPPAGFDVVTFVASLHHMDLVAGLSRARELVAPGGRLLVVGLSCNRSVADWAIAALSVPVVRLLGLVHREDRHGGVVVADPATSLAEVRRAAQALMPGVRVRRGLYYRYLLSWRRPVASQEHGRVVEPEPRRAQKVSGRGWDAGASRSSSRSGTATPVR